MDQDPLTKIEVFEVDPSARESLFWIARETNQLYENWQLSLNNMKRQLRRNGLPTDKPPLYEKPQGRDSTNWTYWKSLTERAGSLRYSIKSYLARDEASEIARRECQRALDLTSDILSQALVWLGVEGVQEAHAVNSSRLKSLLKSLLDSLEQIAIAHPEVYDTDVGEKMSDFLVRNYVKRKKRVKPPASFGMFSAEGDSKIGEALKNYISKACTIADEEGIDYPESRLSTIQDDSVASEGSRHYDDFFGHLDSI